MNTEMTILQPVAVLVAWSLVMWAWMIAVRLPAMKRAGIDLAQAGRRQGAGRRPRAARQGAMAVA